MTNRPTHETVAGSRYLALRKLGRELDRPTAELLQLYALEGFLSRLVRSPHRDRLVLKGGMLLAAFGLRRPTRDVDFLALRTANEEAAVRELVKEVASVEIDDGLVFRLEAITSAVIRDEDIYRGVRVRLEASLSTARLIFQADVNVGDPVVPGPVRTVLPTLLDGPALELLAYPKAMVLAEKLVTALQRGRANTRWRDFADLYALHAVQDLDPAVLVTALREVARHRQATLRPLSTALHGMADAAQPRWQVWWRKQGLDGHVPASFGEVLAALDVWADAVLREAAKGE